MWKEYSRETPGRPGLNILISAALLASTLWLAARVTTAKTVPLDLGDRVKLAGWPISFRLPAGARQLQDDDSSGYYDLDDDGSSGEEAFQMPLGRSGAGHVLVRFQVFRPGLSPEAAARKLFLGNLADPQDISVGAMKGLIAEGASTRSPSNWIAVACLPDGLGVGIRVLSTESSRSTEALLRAICDSVRFKTWVVRR